MLKKIKESIVWALKKISPIIYVIVVNTFIVSLFIIGGQNFQKDLQQKNTLQDNSSKDNYIILNTKIISRTDPKVESTIIYDQETLEMYSVVISKDTTALLPLLDEDGNARKYNNTDDKENNLVVLSMQGIDPTRLYTLYDPKTLVMYNIVYECHSYKVTPMYNEDGSVKLCDKEVIKPIENKETQNIKEVNEIKDIKSDKEVIKSIENKEIQNIKEDKNIQNFKNNKKGKRIKEYKEVEEIEGTKKIKTITKIEEYKEIKKSKLNKILDNIKNILD